MLGQLEDGGPPRCLYGHRVDACVHCGPEGEACAQGSGADVAARRGKRVPGTTQAIEELLMGLSQVDGSHVTRPLLQALALFGYDRCRAGGVGGVREKSAAM